MVAVDETALKVGNDLRDLPALENGRVVHWRRHYNRRIVRYNRRRALAGVGTLRSRCETETGSAVSWVWLSNAPGEQHPSSGVFQLGTNSVHFAGSLQRKIPAENTPNRRGTSQKSPRPYQPTLCRFQALYLILQVLQALGGFKQDSKTILSQWRRTTLLFQARISRNNVSVTSPHTQKHTTSTSFKISICSLIRRARRCSDSLCNCRRRTSLRRTRAQHGDAHG